MQIMCIKWQVFFLLKLQPKTIVVALFLVIFCQIVLFTVPAIFFLNTLVSPTCLQTALHYTWHIKVSYLFTHLLTYLYNLCGELTDSAIYNRFKSFIESADHH